MSDNTHAAMCVYCGETIIYDTRQVTDMADAHAKIVAHDQQCPKNPLVARIAEVEDREAALAAHLDRLKKIFMSGSDDEQIGEALHDTPFVSLSLRDALKQAEALELVKFQSGPDENTPQEDDFDAGWDAAFELLGQRAKELRQQAEGLQVGKQRNYENCTLECGAYGTYCKCKDECHQ
ncbi:hypothetical protein SAMN04487958_107152 [Vreelandella subterranea]|uniref:Uncharacterized protein n=1 Tax=Vreelandella subterranea TaxID=416874 RepID=A0A1H9UQI5_9GAMM|nr:hypothetical protein [Halomonas subterranea]SES11608.1 hypothetical protein SAMN04487958_107152 [Halomonas subterranea]